MPKFSKIWGIITDFVTALTLVQWVKGIVMLIITGGISEFIAWLRELSWPYFTLIWIGFIVLAIIVFSLISRHKTREQDSKGQPSIEHKLRDKLVRFRKCLVNAANNLKKEEVNMNNVEEALKSIEEHDAELMKIRGYPAEHPEALIYAKLNTYGIGTDWLIQHDPETSNLLNSVDSLKTNADAKFKELIRRYMLNLNIGVSQIIHSHYANFSQQPLHRSLAPFASKVILFDTLDKIETEMNIYIKANEKKTKKR